VGKVRLRTKFLLSLLAISTGLTAATLLIVSYSVQRRVRENLRDDLRNSVATYQTFEKQRDGALRTSTALLANLPNVRALMTTEDSVTIQDASADVWKLSGSDLLVLANRAGSVAALRTTDTGLETSKAQELLRRSLDARESRDWWFDGHHLFEVWIQPIYFGTPSQNTTVGLLALGDEVGEAAAMDFGKIASSEVSFNFGAIPVATTLSASQQVELDRQIQGQLKNPSGETQEIEIGSETYLATTVGLSSESGQPVSLTVLKSLDKATLFLSDLNHVLIGLGLLSVLAGSGLVFLISHTFTRPLANLVSGVRALEKGDFNYALESRGGDEVTEVTDAFLRMRSHMQSAQVEQKQLEERLRQAHKMEAVGRLAGGVAHDFNNLLTVIRGNSDLLIDREGADKFQKRCLEQIQKASDRAVSMTRQLLAFSRMQVLQPRSLDLNGIVVEMGKMLPRLIGEHIEYSFSPGSSLALIKADPGQIEQVILNLAVNARDAMPNGGSLTVRTQNILVNEAEAASRPPMQPGAYVLLSVTDTGHGMDDATKIHIFEPFFTTKEVGKGTGLGLATVYGVVKQSGGFIWLISSPGNGTTFEIYLPQATEIAAKPEGAENRSPVPQGTETILVVEDEDGVRDLACQFLRVKGYTVLEAGGGQEALDIARQHAGTIHLLLSDMVMPRMNGGELAAGVKEICPDIRVAFMSGYSEFSRGNLAQGFPEAPVLQKPFSPLSLVEIVRAALAQEPAERARGQRESRVT
jgi:signal transduction histidine kinase/ActR/RegA family two-component response regulator